MKQKPLQFIFIQIGTILSILFFAYFFHEGFIGPVFTSAREVEVKIEETARGFVKPVRLSIPKIGVNAKVQSVGVTAQGLMANPTNFTDVGWYSSGTVPGEVGSAVIAGHVDNALGLRGVFKYLHTLIRGDHVYITDENGTKIHFKVVSVKTYPYNEVPTEELFHESEKTYIRLITCGGSWLKKAKTYDKRIVVTAEYVP